MTDSLSGHGFTLIGLMKQDDHQHLLLRNPAGVVGRWAQNLDDCPYDLRKKLYGICGSILGSFWIKWSDFLNQFSAIEICRYRPSWSVLRLRMVVGGVLDHSQKMVRISASDRFTLCVSSILTGVDPAKVSNVPEEIRYEGFKSISWISVHRTGLEVTETIDELVACEMVIGCTKDLELTKGDYIIMIANLSGVKSSENVAIHTSIPINAKLCDWDPSLMLKVYQLLVIGRGSEVIPKQVSEQ